MSKKILGNITVAAPGKIHSEFLAAKLCCVNDKGLREEASIISSKVFKDCSYFIEYDPKEIDLQQDFFVEITYADLHLRSVDFSLDPLLESFTKVTKNFDPLNPEEESEELVVDIVLSDLNFIIEVTGTVKTARDKVCPDISILCNQISLTNSMSIDTLEQTVTDENGRFLIVLEQQFEPLMEQICHGNISEFKTDLDIQIVAEDSGQSLIMRSDIFYDVKNKIEHDFIWSNENYVGLSKIAKQQATLKTIPSLRTIGENVAIPVEHIDYFSNKMGISIDEATHFVNAKNMGIQFNCNEDIMFALLDGNTNANYTSILFKTDAELLEKVNNAIENNIIDISKENLEEQIADLKTEMITEYIQAPQFISKYETIGVEIEEDKENIVIATIEWMNDPLLQHSGVTLNDYLLEEEMLTEAQYEKAVLYDGITAVSDWNTELAEEILDTFDEWTKIDDLIAGKDDILGIMNDPGKTITIPESFQTAEEYVEYIDSMLEREYPSQYLKNEICKEENETFLKNTEIETFLNNNPDFQFGQNHALVTVEKEEMELNGIDKEALKVELQKVEQLYQLTPLENKSEIMEVMWNLDLTSAHSIASYTRPAFNELITQGFAANNNQEPGRTVPCGEIIDSIHNISANITAQTNLIMHQYGLLTPPIPTPVIPASNYNNSDAGNGGLPTIKDLFGSQDYFQYPESRTLLSPAAYLMDLLQFIKGSDKNNTKLDKLFERRPDIKHILLNCSNTDNIMPHIDLVNEILEIAVAKTAEISFNEEEILEALQTNWETNDLIAYPENTLGNYIAEVYDELKSAEMPWSLPFYFYLEEYRSYLKQLSLSREEIIKYFTEDSKTNKTAKELCEFLGLTAKDIEIITTEEPDINDLEKYYKNEEPVGKVLQLIELTGLSYDEIKELVTSYYINPEIEGDRYMVYTQPGINSESDVKPGTLEGTFIQKTTAGASNPSPDATFYDRFHRFERLRKKLNLKVHELDLIIKYLGVPLTSENDILKIAYLLKVKEQLNLKLEETLLLTGNFKCCDYPAYVNLYDFLFLRKTENYELKEDFVNLVKETGELSTDFKYNKIPTMLPYISSIKIGEDSYNRIIAGENITPGGTPTIQGLSQIFRVAYLCKSLNITEEEYYFLKSVAGLSNLTHPKNLLQFIHYVNQIKSYGFNIADLAYILCNQKVEGQTIALDKQTIIAKFNKLQEELKALKMEDDAFYLNHILNNLQNWVKPLIDEAIEYIFNDFDTQNIEDPDLATVQTFIHAHPDLFSRFNDELLGEPGKTLEDIFLENGTCPEKKLRTVLVGLGLENELTIPDFSVSAAAGKYYSEQDIRDIFTKIKSDIVINILNETYNFNITATENYLDPARATEYNSDTAVRAVTPSENSSQEMRRTQTNSSSNRTILQSKYARHIDGNHINVEIDVADFITNNAPLFPANTEFLWPQMENNNYISGTTARYKTFVFEKDMAVYDGKVAELGKHLSKFLDATELDATLDIILKPDEVFAQGDPENTIRDFISEKFKAFMPVSEAISKLYRRTNPDNNIENGGFLVRGVKSGYLKNYCDRVDLVFQYLMQDLQIDAIVRTMMTLCNITEEEYMTKYLFEYFSYNTDNTSANANNVASIFGFMSSEFAEATFTSSLTAHGKFIEQTHHINKLAQFVKTFKISHEMLYDIFKILNGKENENEKFEILNILDLPSNDSDPSFTNSNLLKKYLNLATAIGLSHTWFTQEHNFFEFFYNNNATKNLSKDAKQYISEITNCAEVDLNTLIPNILPDGLYIEWFQHLLKCRRIISFLGIKAKTITELHKINENAITKEHAEKLRQILKSKYSESEWNKISADLRDTLRIKQRDALRDYLILNYNKGGVKFKSSNDLFHYYLIDPEMIPMAKTSRLIQATLSVQLFIQRILMGMENTLSFKETEKEELIWRRNYRVWEANRKILFFPENWLDPELRHNKTEIFKSIEEKLLQNDIDDNTVLQAYYEYVEKLEEVANLEILSAYRRRGANATSGNFIAFVGRTQGSPHKYFYRTLDLTGVWTPWEEITNGIKADIVRLAYWNGSMYMFWPEVYITSEVPKERMKYHITKTKTTDDGIDEVSIDDKYFNKKGEFTAIRMAWSRYKNGKWTKAVFCDEVYVEPCNDGSTTNINFNIITAYNDILEISPYFIRKNGNNEITVFHRADFHFNGVRLYLKYPSETSAGWSAWHFTGGSEMITDFGERETLNSKAICNKLRRESESAEKSHFKIRHYSDNFDEQGQLELFNLELFNKDGAAPKYHILYEDMCLYGESWQIAPSNVTTYIKPLVLEDQYNGKRFLGIPYKWKDQDIKIVGKKIANLKYNFVNLYYPYIEDIKKIIQEGYSKLFDSAFHDIDNTGEEGSRRRLLIKKKNFYEYYGANKVNIFPIPDYEELSFGNITQNNMMAIDESSLEPPVASDGTPNGGIIPVYTTYDIPKIEDPYAIYNWEMFYHIPMLIADNLSRNMRFEEAQKWYHLIFDPTFTNSKDNGAKKYWKIKPFRELFDSEGNITIPKGIQEFIDKVNSEKSYYSKLIAEWEAHPFNPHLVATTRTVSYMQYVVRKYLENIIAWADMYFTKDTREDINQAALLYILAADILGVRPQKLEGSLSDDKSYKQLTNNDYHPDGLSNVYVTISEILTVMADHLETQGGSITGVEKFSYSVSYFGAPHNDKMEECWDTVADRLFKIRNCMNIQGIVRELPLTSPPIDPGLIAAAMASGADLSTALSTLAAPLPLYRFSYMLQKAIEFTNDVKALGTTFLSVLEKCDAEELAILRTTHERAILNAMTAIREKAIEEATKNIEALENSKVAVVARKEYYKNKKKIYPDEQKALDLHKEADKKNERASDLNAIASVVGLLPQLVVTLIPQVQFGGIHLSDAMKALATIQSALALKFQNEARETDTKASYERRYEDWVFQGNQADTELKQIDKQLAASLVRLAMAEKELENHEKQMELKMEEFEFMKEKFTNKQLYNWMKGQVSKLYQQAYQMAHKLALAAEKAFKFEKQNDGYGTFITPAYWDNLKEGLMSGELLYQDLRRLEVEYMETNERDIELSKDISLAMIDPEALNDLRTSGECDFEIPETLYDIDHPGHYLRRIKTVSISIPAVTGPYSGVTCKLSMQNNRFRKSITVGNDGYAYKGMSDTRFEHNIIGIQSIATSTGNNDSGMFEFNFNDERYLPFEGAGAIGRWRIDLPTEIRKFDYATIADVILHVKYTAKDAGGMLKKEAEDNITGNFNSIMSKLINDEAQLVVAHNLKAEFADTLHQLCETETASLTIEKKHLPFMVVDYVARNTGKSIIIEDILFSPKSIESNYTNGTELTDNGITIELTPFNNATLSDDDDIYMIIQYKIE